MDFDAEATAAQPDIHEMLRIINRDLRGANALARACLAGLATISSEARHAIALALPQDATSGGYDSGFDFEAAVAKTRRQLNTTALDRLRAALQPSPEANAAEAENTDSERGR